VEAERPEKNKILGLMTGLDLDSDQDQVLINGLMLGILDDIATDIEETLQEFSEHRVIFLEGEEDLVGFDFLVGEIQDTNDDVSNLAVDSNRGGESEDIERADPGVTVDDGPLKRIRELGGDVVNGLDIGDPVGEDLGKDSRGTVTGVVEAIGGKRKTIGARTRGQ
jgi:hypothetical protein